MSTTESTAIATRQSSPVSPAREQARLTYQKAELLARSTMVPAHYQNNVANVLVALEYANRLGCSELAVMQNLAVIRGKPSLSSTFLIGTVNACGRFTPIRYRMQGTEGKDDWGCRAVAKDRETGEECVGPLITIALAKAEGWYSKKDKYGNETSKWQTMPELMLNYRAAAWWTRLYCPELSLGLHTSDEIEDIGPAPVTPAQHAKAIEAALATVDEPRSDSGKPDFETVSENENGDATEETTTVEEATTTEAEPDDAGEIPGIDERTRAVRARYFATLNDMGMSAHSDRRPFQQRLADAGKVNGASCLTWKAADYREALAALEDIKRERAANA